MTPPSPSTVSLILGLCTVAAALAGHYLSRRGKRDEVRQQQVAQAFEERNTAFEQVSALADRYKSDADYQREMRAKDRAEHAEELARERELRERERVASEGRWSRQVDRCRGVMDSSWTVITNLIRFVPPEQQITAGHALDDITEHRADHPDQ